MRISVIGCGYLGAVHAAGMAASGHDVVGIDVDPAKVELLASGVAPFHEPEFEPILQAGIASGRLRFSTDFADAADAELHFLAVGTPQRRGSDEADLSFVESAVDALAPHLAPGSVIAGKSTVPVGTAERLRQRIPVSVALAWNPEFLREGHAVDDTLRPDRIVYGLPKDPDDAHRAATALDTAYAAQLEAGVPRIAADLATAELVKASANAFLAMKISFINAVADVCAAAGADIETLADALGHDDRIGRRFLGAGLGFGGGCLPKDIRAYAARAGELGADGLTALLRDVDTINIARRHRAVDLLRSMLGGELAGRRIAVLGLAFKPDSDDLRDSPALSVAAELTQLGADVVAHDPAAGERAKAMRPDLRIVETAEEAVTDADAVAMLTEWTEYRQLDPVRVAELARGRVVLDARNRLDRVAWRAAGWDYRGLGRDELPPVAATAG
jgi:UDPglucose 6-dehydrogenase